MASYDVFLSYNSKDKADVEYFARWLRDEHKLKVWLDKWNLIPGEPWEEELEKALDDCKTVAVFLGSSGIGPWANEEMRAALDARVNKKILRVIPVLLPGAADKERLKLPAFLARLTWVDFRSGLDDKAMLHHLVCGIKGIPPGDPASEDYLPKPEILPMPGMLHPDWRVPNHHNAVFTGREDELKVLANALLYDPRQTGTAVPQVITCTIGIGKTQLAIEFCYRYGRYFQGVHWINAQQDIGTEIAACGAEMELPFWPNAIEDQLRVTLRAWQKSGPHLLVLDCVESPEILRKWLPKLNGFCLLLTTLHHDWPLDFGVQTHPLKLLALPESLRLLRKLAPRLNNTPDADLEAVAERLDNLPLALDLAGRYLDERRTLTPQDYLKELDDVGGGLEHASLLDWVGSDNPTNHETNLVTTFLLIWQQLGDAKQVVVDEVARRIFLACGYCAPNTPIPDKIIYHVIEGSERIADRALKRLYNLGLLTEKTAIHHLLAEFARHQDQEKKSLEALADTLTRLSYEANTTGLPAAFASLRPHVEATVLAMKNANMKNKADDLWGNLGTHYRIVAEFKKAEDANRQALTIDEEIFGHVNPNTALRYNNLGRVLHAEGKLDIAKQNYEEALSIDEKTLDPDPSTVALRLNNLGMLLKDQGHLKEAKEKIEQALTIDKKTVGPNHRNVARDINNLGLVLKDMYQLQSALEEFQHAQKIDEEEFERARKINKETLESSRSNVVRDLNNIGWVLKDMGEFKEALDTFRRAYAIDEAALGQRHPNVAIDLNNIGWVLREMEIYEEALEQFIRARSIDEEAYGSIHPTVARDTNNIGNVLKDLGKFKEALETFENALVIYEKAYSSNHPDVATILNHIGTLLKTDGKLVEAKQHFERALEIDRAVFGTDHLAFSRDIHNLGIVLKDLGEVEHGKQLIKQAKEIYEKSLPADHPLVLAARENL
jgi:tetratricopeptide (TPR) repeat protein